MAKPLKLKPFVPKEFHEQVTVFKWAKANEQKYPKLKLLFAIPNGAHFKSAKVAMTMKAAGLKNGVPDIFLAAPGYGGCPGLFIELKRSNYKRTAALSNTEKAQDEWDIMLDDQGYTVMTCCGAEPAIRTIKDYLGIDE